MQPHDRFYPIQNDFRNPYARDRDRIVHCGSFRRLEYKTQVFLNHEGDYFRTRLTHSLEVSQIARTIAQALGLNETLCEAIALAHDLGHTPFGHVGGDKLDALLRKDGHVHGFDHNFQSFRVLTRLEKRYIDHEGLNLTFATLEGVLKHSYPYKKPFLSPLLDEYFKLDRHPSFEAMVVDLADEIAYTSHDIDDGIKYNLITFDTLLQEPLAQRVHEIVLAQHINRAHPLYRHRFVAALITLLVSDLIEQTRPKLAKYRTGTPYTATLPSTQPIPVAFSATVAAELKRLKKHLFVTLYRHQAIVTNMHAGKTCVTKLYETYTSDTNLLPPQYRDLLTRRPLKRVVADFIAAMTDRYAMKSYHEMYGMHI